MACELCDEQRGLRVVKESEHAFVIVSRNALKKGHVLIIPRRHVTTLSKLTPEELQDFFVLVDVLKEVIRKRYDDPVMGFNVGTHCSEEHLHMQIFPSKKCLRGLNAEVEGLSMNPNHSPEDFEEMKQELLNSLK